jgi:hypothetical protein
MRAKDVLNIIEKILMKDTYFFRPHLNRRFAQKIMGLQNHGSPNFGNFMTLQLGISGQNDIWVLVPWLTT